MKKICILTLNGYFNYGNRLQNYALTKVLENRNFEIYTAWYEKRIESIKSKIKSLLWFIPKYKRFSIFYTFSNMHMKKINYKKAIKQTWDHVIIGSDQVWNINEVLVNKYLFGTEFKTNNLFSYAASFGINEIPIQYKKMYFNELKKISYISVREFEGKKILFNLLNKNDITVNIDPTMLLNENDWNNIIKKPKKLKSKKYILNYFLGNISENENQQIKKFAEKNDCEIINLMDKESELYNTGPSEFLYLEKNAFLICTDSFHSCVFSIIFNRPFVVFDRHDKNPNMSSRIDTLLEKFKLMNRKFNNICITSENLQHDYIEAYKILKFEQEKANKYINKALKIKDDLVNE